MERLRNEGKSAEAEVVTIKIERRDHGEPDHQEHIREAVAEKEHRRENGGRAARECGEDEFSVASASAVVARIGRVFLRLQQTKAEKVDGEDIYGK